MTPVTTGSSTVAVSANSANKPSLSYPLSPCPTPITAWWRVVRCCGDVLWSTASWESAAPPLKDPNRVPTPPTLRRWCRSLDSSPAFSSLRSTLQAIEQKMAPDEQLAHGSLRLALATLFCFLRV